MVVVKVISRGTCRNVSVVDYCIFSSFSVLRKFAVTVFTPYCLMLTFKSSLTIASTIETQFSIRTMGLIGQLTVQTTSEDHYKQTW